MQQFNIHNQTEWKQNDNDSFNFFGYKSLVFAISSAIMLAWCTPNKKENNASLSIDEKIERHNTDIKGISNNAILKKSEMNSQANNTDPYFGTHKPELLTSMWMIEHNENCVRLADHQDIILSPDAGESEMIARKSVTDTIKDKKEKEYYSVPNNYVYLHKDALNIFLNIQKEFSIALQHANFKNWPVYLEISSWSRSHISQVQLAKTNNNVTDAMSAHEVGLALDITLWKYRIKNKQGEKVQITDEDYIAKMNTVLRAILKKNQWKTIFITPESTGIVHTVCLIYGPKYNSNAKPMDHSPHSAKAWKQYHENKEQHHKEKKQYYKKN